MLGRRIFSIALIAAPLGAACEEERTLPPCVESAPQGGPTVETGGDPVVLAAGDIANPSHLESAQATARLLDKMNGLVIALGDEALDNGSIDDFLGGYANTWGRHRWRTRPILGNHEYDTPHAGAYFAYFCAAAGEPFKGFYSFDLGAWHVVALNTACIDGVDEAPGCDAGSEQEQWLRSDLTQHATACTLALGHHPRFSSADGDEPSMAPLWRALHEAHVDLALSGHAHVYERFAPMTPDGAVDPSGIRQFVVGTGGQGLAGVGELRVGSEATASTYGILRLTLHAASYDWEFVDVDGRTLDRGGGQCH